MSGTGDEPNREEIWAACKRQGAGTADAALIELCDQALTLAAARQALLDAQDDDDDVDWDSPEEKEIDEASWRLWEVVDKINALPASETYWGRMGRALVSAACTPRRGWTDEADTVLFEQVEKEEAMAKRRQRRRKKKGDGA